MSWLGKFLGSAFGFMFGGPLGALIGAAMGHNVDSGLRRAGDPWRDSIGFEPRERSQAAFFATTFSVMGHVAAVRKDTSRDDVELGSRAMDRLGLSDTLRDAAGRLFKEGKAKGFPLDDVLDQFHIECRESKNLLRLFVEFQLQAVFAEGRVHRAQRERLNYIAERLQLPASELNHREAILRAGVLERDGKLSTRLRGLDDAYAVLNVPSDASNEDVERGYRRLMSQHHPDKLLSKGLPEEMMKLATQKTLEIKAAFERIKEARGV